MFKLSEGEDSRAVQVHQYGSLHSPTLYTIPVLCSSMRRRRRLPLARLPAPGRAADPNQIRSFGRVTQLAPPAIHLLVLVCVLSYRLNL